MFSGRLMRAILIVCSSKQVWMGHYYYNGNYKADSNQEKNRVAESSRDNRYSSILDEMPVEFGHRTALVKTTKIAWLSAKASRFVTGILEQQSAAFRAHGWSALDTYIDENTHMVDIDKRQTVNNDLTTVSAKKTRSTLGSLLWKDSSFTSNTVDIEDLGSYSSRRKSTQGHSSTCPKASVCAKAQRGECPMSMIVSSTPGQPISISYVAAEAKNSVCISQSRK